MAMLPGTVLVGDDGTEIGADTLSMAGSIYLQLKAAVESDLVPPFPIAGGSEGAAMKRGFASLANRLGMAIVTYLQTNAQAKITPLDNGLQLMPASTVENTLCKAPGTDKFISIV